MIKTYTNHLFCLCWILILLTSCSSPGGTEPGLIESLENERVVVTPPQVRSTPAVTPQIAEVTRIIVDEARPTPTLPVFPMMDVVPIQPRPEFVRLVGPAEYSIVESDFYHLEVPGDGNRITGAMSNGFESAICVKPFLRPLIQHRDDLRDLSLMWDRMTLLVDGEQKEPYSSSGMGLLAFFPDEEDEGTQWETQWIEGEDYCWSAPLQAGIHEVVFQFRQTSGEVHEYRWLFEIID